jgi:transposase-like protein
LTPTQVFLQTNYIEHYDQRHVNIAESGESDIVNSYAPERCPHCSSREFNKSGHTRSGVQRYKCECGKTFLPTTGTIFDDHKISISEWIEYCLNLFRHVSITADSWNNKNDFNTSRYWLEKVFVTLENVQESIVLSDKVWLDEPINTQIKTCRQTA